MTMLHSKATLLATAAALAGAISGGVAAASADTTGASGASGASGATGTIGSTGATGTAATITVNGAGFATLDSTAALTVMQSDYLGALTSALGDAHAKAAALAAAVGDTIGAVTNITEQSNDSYGCAGPVNFAAGGVARGAPTPATPTSHKSHGHKPKKATARIVDDTTTSCTIEADVTVTYSMS